MCRIAAIGGYRRYRYDAVHFDLVRPPLKPIRYDVFKSL